MYRLSDRPQPWPGPALCEQPPPGQGIDAY